MAESAWLTLSSLQHYAFCQRQAYLLRDGVWSDNHLTVEGDAAHERVDSATTDHRRGVKAHHRIALSSQTLRVHGVADTVEELPSGRLLPVEHKRGRGAGDLRPTIVQVVAQALCLEEMTGASVPDAAIYIVTERRREAVVVNQWKTDVVNLIDEARRYMAMSTSTAPDYEARRCRSCSVLGSCQPIIRPVP